MEGTFQRIDPASPVYQEFARLYRIAREMHPSEIDRWNGELYARNDGLWGGFDPKTGSMRLSQDAVLAHLTGSTDGVSPEDQARALATVFHETEHARNVIDAPMEVNAVRTDVSKALDEGLTERNTINEFPILVKRAGYSGLVLDEHEYEGAVEAADRLVDYAAAPNKQNELIRAAVNKPVVMRWDVVAGEIVRNRLGDVVPQDARHQQAARAELINAMAHAGWSGLHNRPLQAGELVAHDTAVRLDAAVGRIQQHYRENPNQPYPAVAPNRGAVQGLDGEQARMPQPIGRDRGQSPVQLQPGLDPALRAALSGQAAPSGAVRYAPNLGDGARGRTGGQGQESGRTVHTPPERGDR